MTSASPAPLKTLRDEAAGCRACHLWKEATQTVFGEGPQQAQIMLVGEQPGDKEDIAGQTVRRAGGSDARPRAGGSRDRP